MRYLRVVSIAALLTVAPTCHVFADLQILFYSNREGREIGVGQRVSEVFVMNPDGSNPVNLTKQIGVDSKPSVSPDKTKYLFTSKRTGDNEIFMMNVDGSNLVNLTNDPDGDQSPRWSPDGRQIRWSKSGPWRIFVMNSDGSNKRNLGDGYRPRWSRDGRMIGFALGRGDQHNAFVMNADGSGRRRVTDDLFPTRFISWSRDGTKIAFSHKPLFGGLQGGMYIVNLDGTGLSDLWNGHGGRSYYGAAWSPDGSKIAFRSEDGIYVVNSDGPKAVNLTGFNPVCWAHTPKWSPDGSKILYEVMVEIGDRQFGEIYIMNADGSNPVNLTNHPWHDWNPSWIRLDFPTTSVSPREKLVTTWGRMKAVASGISIALPIQSLDGQ